MDVNRYLKIFHNHNHSFVFYQISGAELVMRDVQTGCVNVGADVLLCEPSLRILV